MAGRDKEWTGGQIHRTVAEKELGTKKCKWKNMLKLILAKQVMRMRCEQEWLIAVSGGGI
jgi:hypothetical protein